MDIVSLAAHKIYGPKGVGALFIHDGTKLQKIFYGGEQEIRRRPGTENIVAIAGFAEAVEQMTIQKSERKRLCALRDEFEKELLNKIPDIKINCQETERVYSISNIYFPCLPGDSMLMNLDMKGIFISTGSACSSGSQSPSHVLRAMGFDEQRVANSIRISLGCFTTESHLSQAIDAIYNIYQTRSKRKRDRGL